MKLTQDIAFPIIHKLVGTMDYNINIMDEQGVIVASSDAERLDRIHEGAIQVLQSKKPLIINEEDTTHFLGTRKGVNLAIEFMGEIVGVVGVTGEPDELMRLAQMTKITVELMLQQEYLQKQTQFEYQLMHSWVMELISPEPIIDEMKITKHAQHFLNIDMEKDTAIFLIEIPTLQTFKSREELMKKSEMIDEMLCFLQGVISDVAFLSFTNDNLIILGITIHNKSHDAEGRIAEKIYRALKTKSKRFLNSKIAVGNRNILIKGFRQSYFEAKQSLELMNKFGKDEKVSHIKSWGLIRMLDQVPKTTRQEFLSQYPIHSLPSDLLETLHVLFECDHNLTLTAEKLRIHRNTLAYRLDNIHQLLKLNPKSVKDSSIIQIITILQKLDT